MIIVINCKSTRTKLPLCHHNKRISDQIERPDRIMRFITSFWIIDAITDHTNRLALSHIRHLSVLASCHFA